MERSAIPGVCELFFLSDWLGEELDFAASWITRRFEKIDIETSRFGSLRTVDAISEVLQKAASMDAFVLHGFLSAELRRFTTERCADMELDAYDPFLPLFSGLSDVAGETMKEDPGRLHPMDNDYFKRVKAIEYTIAADDGGNSSILKEADVVIVGISRTGKSPLCMYLAHKGIKAANIPLVPEIEPPVQLFQIEPSRIIGLTRSTLSLEHIRAARMHMMGLGPDESKYVKYERILREIDYASGIMESLGAVVFDVTSRAIEETAHEILKLLRHGTQ
jgi:hypothetical protein